MKKKETTVAKFTVWPKGWSLSEQQNYRDMHAKGFVEAYCPHGTGHHRGVHGCDGCCGLSEAKKIMKQTTRE